MLFKSKLFWISVVLISCAVIFFAVTYHRAKQPSEPIKVYKVPEDVGPHKIQRLSGRTTETKQIRQKTAEEVDTTDTKRANLSENTSHHTNAFTDTDESQGASNQPNADYVSADELKTEAETEAAYIAQKAELRTKITQLLQERKDLFDQIYDLADFGDGEPYALRLQLQKEAHALRRTIFDLCHEYIRYTMDDSPFQFGGEFYDLMKQNRMAITTEWATLEEIKELESNFR